jgi:hypothetical protein
MNWSMSRHDRRHWKAPSLIDHCLRAISRVWLDRHWWEHGRQNGTLRTLVGLPILFFQMWHFGSRTKGRGKLCLHCVKGFIWTLLCSIASRHCERFWVERHRLIDALAALNVDIGIPIRDLCALKKWCAVKCCLDFLRGFGVKLWWFEGLRSVVQ